MRGGCKTLPPNLPGELAVFLKLPSKRGKEDGEDQLLFMTVSDTKAGPASEL